MPTIVDLIIYIERSKNDRPWTESQERRLEFHMLVTSREGISTTILQKLALRMLKNASALERIKLNATKKRDRLPDVGSASPQAPAGSSC